MTTHRIHRSAGIEARGLTKRYGDVTALDGLDMFVPEGTVLALLGPNGAGKTTAVSILATLMEPDSGSAVIAGADVVADPGAVRQRIGLSGQYAAVDETLTGFENLDMIGSLYHLGRTRARRRARELLDRFSLTDVADRMVRTYSGGMRRRLDLAGALVAQPPVLFLDEPTTGLDPASRAELWDVIRGLVAAGSTLLLTTQYMEEADALADDIVIIDHGREIAHGTGDQLKATIGVPRIQVTFPPDVSIGHACTVLDDFLLSDPHIDGRTLTAPILNGIQTFRSALAALDNHGIPVTDIGLRRPTLDDVFLTLTGARTSEPVVDDQAEPGPRPTVAMEEVA